MKYGYSQPVKKELLMKRVVTISLVLLIALGIGMLGISCAHEAQPARPPIKPPPTEPEEGVYLSPTFIEAEPGQEVTIEVKIKPSGWGVSGSEINLAFAPNVLEVVNIKPGTFLGSSPIVGLKRIDNQGGVVKLALARVGKTTVPSPPGTLATVQFKVLGSASSGNYELELTKVGLADENFEDITNFSVQGTNLKISS